MRIRSVLFLLLLLALCPYFIDLGGSSIWDANEAFYVETPREMIERGDYISPTFNYEPRLNKPVLSYWIVAGFYHVLGVSVGVQRLAIAFGAVAIIGTAFLLAWAGFSPPPPLPAPNSPRPTPNAQRPTLDSRLPAPTSQRSTADIHLRTLNSSPTPNAQPIPDSGLPTSISHVSKPDIHVPADDPQRPAVSPGLPEVQSPFQEVHAGISGSRAGGGVPWAGMHLETALWAALGLAIAPRLLMFSRRIFIDIYITMFMGLTLLFFALAERYPARRRTFLPLMYAAVGLGTLTKGPIAIVLPGAVFAAYLLVHGELRRIRTLMIPSGILIVAALVLPYCIALYARHGWAPIEAFVFGENVARFTEGVGVDSSRGSAFYLPVIFSDSFPWSVFLVPAAAAWFARHRSRPLHDERAARVRTLLWLWMAVIVLFFTASAAKQDLYIFPIVPAVAALGALAVAHHPGAAVRWTAVAAGIIVAIAGAGMLYLIGSPNGVYGVDGAPVMGLIGVAGGAAVVILASTRRLGASLIAIAITFIALNWVFVLHVLPGFERYKPVPGFVQTLAGRLQPDDVLVTYDEALPSLVFYLRRHVRPLFDAGDLITTLAAPETVYAILSAQNYEDLAPRLGASICIIDRRPTFDVKLRNMLAREPLPELLLVTNRCGERQPARPNSQLASPDAQVPPPNSQSPIRNAQF